MLKLTSKRTLLAIGSAIVLTYTTWVTQRVHAQNPRSAFLAYGMVTIASGQTLRLNAVSVNVGHDVGVELFFLDSRGNVAARAATRLAPGQATFLDFRLPGPTAGNRVQVRALVRWAGDLGPEGYIIPSMEATDDATGRVTVLGPDSAG